MTKCNQGYNEKKLLIVKWKGKGSMKINYKRQTNKYPLQKE